jgi:hypothetical protein
MNNRMDGEYYTARKPELLKAFDEETRYWKPVLTVQYGPDFALALIQSSHVEFEALLPRLPYIGGDENHLTGSLVESAGCLAFYKAMQKHGRTAQETGRVLFDAALARINDPPPAFPPSETLTTAQLMERRRRRARWSQERRYAEDYVYEFVPGDGQEFDYGYDFLECAVHKFYLTQGAGEFTPFYCFLDFPNSQMGLRRTMTLAEGHLKCDPRFKAGRKVEFAWPPPFLKK